MTVIEEVDSTYTAMMVDKVRNYTGYDEDVRTDQQIQYDLDDGIEWFETMTGLAFDETDAKHRRIVSLYASGIATVSVSGADIKLMEVDEVTITYKEGENQWFKMAYKKLNESFGGALIGKSTYDSRDYRRERQAADRQIKEQSDVAGDLGPDDTGGVHEDDEDSLTYRGDS